MIFTVEITEELRDWIEHSQPIEREELEECGEVREMALVE